MSPRESPFVMADVCCNRTAVCGIPRSEYFRTRFRSEVGQSADAASIDVSGVSGPLLRTLIEAMYTHEVR